MNPESGSAIQQRLATIPPDRLAGIRRGIEKESLRTGLDGRLSSRPHPAELGSALTHPHITTDFSESQIELVTGVHASAAGCIDELTRIHQFVYRALPDEMLWVASMPCGLPADEQIPIGRYGTSNVGMAKTVYRTGLAHRYGRRMQTISGIHYNWSMPGIDNDSYFSLIRNFRRHSFLLLVLFGASPAVCSSFVQGRAHPLETIKDSTPRSAVGDFAADGQARLSKRCAGVAGGQLQQPGTLRRLAGRCVDSAASAL